MIYEVWVQNIDAFPLSFIRAKHRKYKYAWVSPIGTWRCWDRSTAERLSEDFQKEFFPSVEVTIGALAEDKLTAWKPRIEYDKARSL
jgi:hypothetical protein